MARYQAGIYKDRVMELEGAAIILAAWYLNAVADAIDHGKGARTLYELWHIVKDASYGILFVYIVVKERWPWWMILGVAVLLYGWELIYKYLRLINFQEWDDRIQIKWLAWLWKIKREEQK